jgi:ribosomal protein S18 acetylase RimI-like enzyme
VAEAHAALAEMFRDDHSFTLSPLPLFRRSALSGASIFRVLLDGDEIAALVQVAPHAVTHELRTVGRRPAYRGRGLGERVVCEGLRLLADNGARDVELSVEAPNEGALTLYRRFAFEIVDRTPVFALGLRG